MFAIIIAILLTETMAEELATPSISLGPRNFNHHSFDANKLLNNLQPPNPTKQGPILFPNDGPPPPRRPLVVTTRPLLESIANSDLNITNIAGASSQLNQISEPLYLARIKDYKPFLYNVPLGLGGDFEPSEVPYADLVKKARDSEARDYRYDEYEERTILPPIYKALSDFAQQKVLKVQSKPKQLEYQMQNPDYTSDYQNNDVDIGTNKDYNQGENYQFSYAVKDQKTGDDFSHSQRSSGAGTNGEYRVRLPDGRMQIVSYTADENGYKADVRYDEEHHNNGNNINSQHNGYTDNQHNDYIVSQHNDYSDKINDYTVKNGEVELNAQNRDYKPEYVQKNPHNDYYNYPDVTKEYNDDYSSEYSSNYPPHKGKFSFVDHKNYENVVPTVKPSYEELKDLFINNDIYRAGQNDLALSTPTPNYDVTTERVVAIGTPKPNLFTNIRNIFPVTTSPLLISSPVVYSTPRNYLVSTIKNLKNRISGGNKPILSDSFIERISKYLKYK